jgi:hypothetical protein
MMSQMRGLDAPFLGVTWSLRLRLAAFYRGYVVALRAFHENSGAMTSPRFSWSGRFCRSRISEAGSTPNAV